MKPYLYRMELSLLSEADDDGVDGVDDENESMNFLMYITDT